MPAVSTERAFADAGCLMSYGEESPFPIMDCSHLFHDGALTPLRGLVFRHRNNGAGERTVGLSQLIQNRKVIGIRDRYQVPSDMAS